MSRRSVLASGFAFRPVGYSAGKACSGRVYSSLRSARIGRFRLGSQVVRPDRLEIWTCSVEFGNGFECVKLLEFVE